jgi:hypothetical protein
MTDRHASVDDSSRSLRQSPAPGDPASAGEHDIPAICKQRYGDGFADATRAPVTIAILFVASFIRGLYALRYIRAMSYSLREWSCERLFHAWNFDRMMWIP